MADKSKKSIAFISTYPPRRCGLATFCSDLIRSVQNAGGVSFEPLVAAMTAAGEDSYKEPVKFEIRKQVQNDYLSAADFLNFSHVDLVCIQHEFGIFGGPAGSMLNLLMDRVNAPIIATLHTVLEEPAGEYLKAARDVCDRSARLIVMNESGIDLLENLYGVNRSKIHLVPHGIPDLPFVDSSYYKHKFNVEGRKTILTFGLLSRNKGIEYMLKALPEIVEAEPKVLYIILGATHPEVLRNDGEEYRFELQRLTEELGLHEHVLFYNQFVNEEQLHNFLCAADLYVTPYMHRQQLTSGTLAFAVGTGKAVISTPYRAAEELLKDDRGIIVGFNNPRGLAENIIRILQDDQLFANLRRRAYDYGRKIIWPVIGKKYWKLFSSVLSEHVALPTGIRTENGSLKKIPEPSLSHLLRLSDDTGLLQHAKFILPDRLFGYCTDDNSRAAAAMAKFNANYPDPHASELLEKYLSFVFYAQRPDGTFHNLMRYDRTWIEPEQRHDSLGRSLWAIGTVMDKTPSSELIPVLKQRFDLSVKHVNSLSPRGRAYAVFGMAEYLKQFPGASEIKRALASCAGFLDELYNSCRSEGWCWFENILCYDNAVLPHAMFTAYRLTGNAKYLQTARQSCDFLIENTYNGRNFSFIGCKGWYTQGQSRASFDQQPLDAASTVLMLHEAYEATGSRDYLMLQKEAFNWFMGKNDLQIPIYDFRTGGCYDGLEQSGVNLNQGAESCVSFLLALLSILENVGMDRKYTEADNSRSIKKNLQKTDSDEAGKV